MRQRIPLILVFLFGVVFIIQYYVPDYYSITLLTKAGDWARVLGFFAFFIAIYSLVFHHTMRIRKKGERWPYSIITLVSLVGMAFAGFYVGFFTNATKFDDPAYVLQHLYMNLLSPLEATMFSLLAFYIASAAARAFRARNVEATLLLVTAVIVMLSRVPIGAAMFSHLPAIGDWILEWPNTAARRAIVIGVGLGGAATSLKVLLGVERSYLGMR